MRDARCARRATMDWLEMMISILISVVTRSVYFVFSISAVPLSATLIAAEVEEGEENEGEAEGNRYNGWRTARERVR